MTQPASPQTAEPSPAPDGPAGIVADWSSDQRAFKNVSWGKAMMWIFLLSDTFVFSCFLLSYMTVRMSTTVPWPNPERGVRADHRRHVDPADPDRHHDLRPDQQQRHDGDGGQFRLPPRPRACAAFMLLTALFGATFVGHAGVRVDQADHGGGSALGQPVGRAAVRLELLHDHRLPRHPCDHRRDLPADHRAQGAAR